MVTLYRIKLKVKEYAKFGETEVNLKKYNIVCSPSNSYCEENTNNEMKDENNNVVQKPNNEQNNDDIGNNNNQENNESDMVILDNTKFYVLTGLLGTVVIEMFVLIIKKTKKI